MGLISPRRKPAFEPTDPEQWAIELAARIAQEVAEMCFRPDHWAMEQAAFTLAGEIADAIGAPEDAVWRRLTTLPNNMLVLLDSPEGWTVLAVFVAHELGVPAPDYKPMVH